MEQTITRKTSRVSKLKVALATVAIGALLVVPSAGANDRVEDVQFSIEGGGFTMDLTNGLMENVDTYGMGMETTGSVDLLVSDLRGTNGNWTVDLVASNFVNDADGAVSTSASGLSVSGNSEVNSDEGIGDVTLATPGNLSTASLLATGAGAHGDHSWTPELTLAIDDGTPAGSYTSWLTVTTNVVPQ